MKHCTDRLITVGSETQLRRSNTILSCSNDCLVSMIAATNWKHYATHFSGCVTLICLGHEKISRQTAFLVLFWSCSWASHKLTAQPQKIIRSLTRWFQLIEGKIMENSQFSKQEDNYFAKEMGDKVILKHRWKIYKINHKASTAQTTAERRLN